MAKTGNAPTSSMPKGSTIESPVKDQIRSGNPTSTMRRGSK